MKLFCFMVLLSVSSLGCVTYNLHQENVRFVYPKLTRYVPQVDSLRPTFRWEGININEGETWDFAIWDAIHMQHLGRPTVRDYTPGERIYYREGLKETSHMPDIRLLPLKKYFWSVKLSSAEQWTTFDWKYMNAYTGGWARVSNSLFLFETPLKNGP